MILLILSSLMVFAANGNPVIDLGQLEVEGELRRPTVTWLDSSKRISNMLPDLFQKEFMKLEKELTQYKSPNEIIRDVSQLGIKGEKNAEL